MKLKLLIIVIIFFAFGVLSLTLSKAYAQSIYPTIDSQYIYMTPMPTIAATPNVKFKK